MAIRSVYLRGWMFCAVVAALVAAAAGYYTELSRPVTGADILAALPTRSTDVAACEQNGHGSITNYAVTDGDVITVCADFQSGAPSQADQDAMVEAMKAAERKLRINRALIVWLAIMGIGTALLLGAEWVARGAGKGFLFDGPVRVNGKYLGFAAAASALVVLLGWRDLGLPEWSGWFPILGVVVADVVLANRGRASRWIRYPATVVVFFLCAVPGVVVKAILRPDPAIKDSEFIGSLIGFGFLVGAIVLTRVYVQLIRKRAPLQPLRPVIPPPAPPTPPHE